MLCTVRYTPSPKLLYSRPCIYFTRAVFRGGQGAAPPGQSPKTIGAHFLENAKYFITILTKSLCGTAKLLFYHYVRFFLQNLPKMCILWVCLPASEMAGKRLLSSSFSGGGFATSVHARHSGFALTLGPQQKNPRYGPVHTTSLNTTLNKSFIKNQTVTCTTPAFAL
jgi:hypothetical protein